MRNENGATISRSAWTLRRSGATRGSAAAARAVGTASSLALVPRVSPGATGDDPVDGLTVGRPKAEDAVTRPAASAAPS